MNLSTAGFWAWFLHSKRVLKDRTSSSLQRYAMGLSLILGLILGLATPFTAQAKQDIQVGVLATRGDIRAIETWQPTMAWLDQQLPDYQFILKPLDLTQIKQAVENNEISFVITNPGQAVILGRQFPLSWLATLKGDWPNGSTQALGSSLIVKSDSPAQHLNDLKSKTAVAVSSNAFGGFLILKQKMAQQKMTPERFFSDINYQGFPLDNLLLSLAQGESDVAIAPACLLEEMVAEGSVNANDFRILDNQAPDGFPCAVSTELYPNWSFAKTAKAPNELATQIAKALLSQPENSAASRASNSRGWASPISPYVIDRMYQSLEIHPLQQPWWQQALIWVKSHQAWGWAFFILFIGLNAYHFLLELKFNKSKRQLTDMHQELNTKTQMLEHAQRVAVVGELGSSLAHEINQPLSAIRNYTQAAQLKLLKGAQPNEIEPILERIDQQVTRVDTIVTRLRQLIKKRPIEKQEVDITKLFDECVTLLSSRLAQHHVDVEQSIQGQVFPVIVDEVGMGQVFINVLNNAADSCFTAQQSGHIQVKFEFSPNAVTVYIQDNGLGLADSSETLKTAFYTTKSTGLGMGLSICRDILEKHHGSLELTPAEPKGCLVSIYLPVNENKDSK
ncbi:MAG: sensor histidine kinase [Vibrio sp.]